ncbi:splicing factor 45-like isoform X2 [Centruroides sculpturatus]|uniref:splicing factor 45-like isoform X2 n=1 Tax=Centruroides sculpturatus TaxID=218467 RepID=UPI000C6E5BB0|nr:splicing factor 45-like isoform X2 [Centruroides sculpturatus]
MSLYDGLGLDTKEKGHKDQKSDLMGWSSGIKLLQSQLQLKKAALTQAKVTFSSVKREQFRKGAVLAPVVNLKSRRDDQDEMPPPPAISIIPNKEGKSPITTGSLLGGEWDIRQEYDPAWPNDYEKIMREKREKKDRDRGDDRHKHSEDKDRDSGHPYGNKHGRRRRERERDKERNREMIERNREEEAEDERANKRDRRERERDKERNREMIERNREEEAEDERANKRGLGFGAAIAPPPSLMETAEKKEPLPPPPFSGASFQSGLGTSVAARIMAKYGFKEGQGLGKQEQGMSQALQVEKTSKRGGKIIHEKDIPKEPPSPPPEPPPPPAPVNMNPSESITEIMKNPSKVVLLRNMVGPGEVDDELEPETKEECGKYGEVVKCLIFEIAASDIPEEEAVRIFIEFKRLESAIKAVVDLNGRYFGGRIVRAGFYDQDRFKRLELTD